MMKKRLYLHLYLALLASALLCLTVAAVAFRVWRDAGGPPTERLERAAAAVAERVPVVSTADAAAVLAQLADEFGVQVVIGDESGPRAGAPSANAFPLPRQGRLGWRRDRMGPLLVVPLEEGGWAALRSRGPMHRLRVHPFFMTLAILAVVMALGSYPVARRVTRRLETLARAVERWGKGDLTSRVPVSGVDEVATLAATFNQAAERLDLLLTQQRQMLANASHELRSPLARLRMGLELIADEPDPTRRQAMVRDIHRDIVELDVLIEDVLLMARSDARVPRRALVPVDLRALLQEEAARTGASVQVDAPAERPVPLMIGDAVLLRHMVRNLLENADLHGGGGAVSAHLRHEGQMLKLAVEDRGPGVPDEDRERIFAPFFRRAVPAAAHPASRVASGHGLGLALVRQVARYHGGEVVHQSPVAGGSRFEVRLPLTHPIAIVAAEPR